MLVSDKVSIGIMQGRLTPSRGRGIQFFPFEEWESEFKKAKELGLNEIDFVFDLERYQENPLWHEEGISKVKKVVAETGVKIKSICVDFFMRRPPYEYLWTKNTQKLLELMFKLADVSNQIGSKNIEIPLLENSSLSTPSRVINFANFLSYFLRSEASGNWCVALETDLPPKELCLLNYLLQWSAHRNNALGLVYDTGNSASLGRHPFEDIKTYGKRIVNVHIKDRVLGGGTVPPGTGAVDFDAVFDCLARENYKGSFILQAARGEDGKEAETVAGQIEFLKKYLKKYGFIS